MIEPISKPKPLTKVGKKAVYTTKQMVVRYKLAFKKLFKEGGPVLREDLEKKLDNFRTQKFAKEVAALAESDAPLNVK